MSSAPVFGKECVIQKKSARFVCFDRWLRRYQNKFPLTKYYCIIERVYFISRLFTLSCFFIFRIMKFCKRLPPYQIRLSYTTFVLTIQKMPRFKPALPIPLFVATPLNTILQNTHGKIFLKYKIECYINTLLNYIFITPSDAWVMYK